METVITASTKKNKNKGREKDKRKDTEEADHVWDENLAHMEIAKKRQSVVCDSRSDRGLILMVLIFCHFDL